jgi:3-oxoacyl-[acyl-carrier protein] reductase
MNGIDLTDKVALVTGASRGIGAAIATRFARAGARVVINYRRNQKAARKVHADVCQHSKGIIVQADVSQQFDVTNLIDSTLVEFGRLDILVNNAGVISHERLERLDPQSARSTLDVNLAGPLMVGCAAARELAANGRIVNVSSIAAVGGFPGQSVYAASKAALEAMTRVWARELAGKEITVNAIAPGVIETEMLDELRPDRLAEIEQQIPMRRCGRPDDVAGVALFLVSDLAGYLTGQVIHVNGGWRV